jgi:LPXTG-motif cell wall-anchored protein
LVLNSTPRRRFGVALGVLLTGVTAGLIGFTGVASAHTPKLSAECKGETTTLNVNLKDYNGQHANTIKVTDGNTTLAEGEFKASYSKKFEVAGNVDHKFLVSVKAWDDKSGRNGWSFDKTLEIKACVTTPPSSSETTTTTTTTEETTPPSSSETTPPSSSSETTTTTTEVTSSSSEAAPVTSPAATTTTSADVENAALAETGASIGLPLGIAGFLLVGGAILLFVVRRRSKA